jgi:hypothetical protein
VINLVNQPVTDFLTYYADARRKLDYAVLLDGAWGSGKTHLANSFLAQHTTNRGKHLYVSLYGITSTRQIEDEFYRLLHPVLASKGMRMAGVVMRGVAKGVLKIDLSNGQGVKESLDLSVPEIDLKEFMGGPGERLLVFDDLERCKMPISDVLGYINAFVEHDGLKVIILAHEAELTRREPDYPSIKEKLVGQTLRVRPDVAAAYPAFLEAVTAERVRTLLTDKRDLVLAVHEASGTENLRILNHAMGDIERIAEHIPDSDWAKEDALDLLLRQALAMSMEVRAGRLGKAVLPLFANRGFERYMRKQESAEPQADELFEQRYNGISLSDPAVSAEVLGKILIDGLSDGELLKAALRKSRYFADPADLPAWRRAWYGFEMSDADYEAALAQLETEFTKRTETEPGIIYHIVGIRLKAAEIGALPCTAAEILSQSKAYADDLKAAGRLMTSIERPVEMDNSRSYDGLGFSSSGTAEFREFVAYYYSLAQGAAEESYAERARAIVAKLDAAPGEFRSDLSHTNLRASPYYRTPILAALPADEFVTAMLNASAPAQVEVFHTFKQRYEYDALNRDLAPERDWLINVRQKLLNAAKAARPMTRYRLAGLVEDDIDPLLKETEEAAKAD